ncbi:MAG: hypothetical protein PVG22_03910 [Chromatiales bacterium]
MYDLATMTFGFDLLVNFDTRWNSSAHTGGIPGFFLRMALSCAFFSLAGKMA